MSEQTPDTDSGMTEGQDPSMEDILASIRKIIAEDDIQAPTPPETVIAESVPETQNLDGDVSQLGQSETLDLDIVEDEAPAIDTDIEALIGDNDAAASDDITSMTASVENKTSESLEDILDLEIPMDETEVLSDVEASSDIEGLLDIDTDEPEALIDLAETETLTLEDELIDLVAEPDVGVSEPDVPDMAIDDKSDAGLVGGALAAMGLGGAAAMSKAGETAAEASNEDDLSLMLDNMLEDSSSYEEASSDLTEERVIDPAAELISEDVIDDDILSEIDFIEDTDSDEVISKSDPDIDLVKSLMADLTEEPLHEEPDLGEAVHEEPELETAALDAVALDDSEELDSSEDDIMDEILSMTLDDEAKLSEEVAAPDLDMPSIEDVAQEITPEIAPEEIAGEAMSLKDIAAAAEADAQASETVISTGAAAGLAAATVAGAAIVSTQKAPDIIETSTETFIEPSTDTALDDIDDTYSKTDDIDAALSQLDNLLAEETEAEEEILTPEPPIEETPEMPRAKKSDAIIDEVTESATAGAFASLNQVVEEKATVAERGDRIGDLVMEALQPMLKEWLDANLKGIVERAVTKEVKRISSGK